jgi:hypothetical protein
MDLTLAATIIVLVVLTLVIFAFVFVVFRSIQKSEHILVDQGNRDQEIITEKDKQKSKAYKIGNLLTNILSGVIAAFAIAMMAFALYFKFSNNLAFINGQSQMVIASNSMSYVARDAQYATNGGYLTDAMVAQEFKRGDILTVEKPQSEEVFTTLQKDSSGKLITEKSIYGNGYTYVPVQSGVLYEIYGYNNDYSKKLVGNSWNSETSIIIHRLVRIWADGDGNIVLNFAGDAVGGLDDVDVKPFRVGRPLSGNVQNLRLGLCHPFLPIDFRRVCGCFKRRDAPFLGALYRQDSKGLRRPLGPHRPFALGRL